ncbi:hypothetical protein [Streptococcus hyointestinalis]|nr:hypothetical protein [Streptococcus hyointestinalis]
MMWHREQETRRFIETRTTLDKLVRAVVLMIPDREFYDVRNNPNLSNYAKDISSLVEESRKLKHNQVELNMLSHLQSEYDQELFREANLQRRLLIFGILMQDKERQKAILIHLVTTYRLYRQVLARREEFRE